MKKIPKNNLNSQKINSTPHEVHPRARVHDSFRQGVWMFVGKIPNPPWQGTQNWNTHAQVVLLFCSGSGSPILAIKKRLFLKELKILIHFLINNEFIEIGISNQIFLNIGDVV